jgi:2-methylcitrate dehydratase PrpD
MHRREFAALALGAIAGAAAQERARAADPKAAQGGGATADRQATVAATDAAQAKGLTEYVAGFVVNTTYDAIPPEVIELGKKSILDGFGLALAGTKAESGPLCLAYLDALDSASGASVLIGTGRTANPQLAALVNGVSIHADDFDDTQLAAAKDRVYGLLTHPTVPVLPPAFALAEQTKASGQILMLAYHVGVEVECKIAEAIAPRHYEDGFHSTGTCGPFGSAAACAKLLGLDVGKVRTAFGIAASRSGGLRENFGTMTKPLQAGHAAASGMEAAQLARLGWTAAQQILEAERGFFHAAGGSFNAAAIANRLGAPWCFSSPGVSIKPYPSGSLSHPAMTEMARLIQVHNIKAEQVAKVEVGANHAMLQALLHHHPQTGLQAKFSMEFCMAILLLERRAGLAQFTNTVVQRDDVKQMIERVRYYIDPAAEAAGYDKMTSLLKITLKNKKIITGQATFGKGSPANPMSFDEVAEKFRGCAEYVGWPAAKTDGVIAFVKTLEAAPDVSKLSMLLTT